MQHAVHNIPVSDIISSFGICVFLCKIENLITTKMVSIHHVRKCSIRKCDSLHKDLNDFVEQRKTGDSEKIDTFKKKNNIRFSLPWILDMHVPYIIHFCFDIFSLCVCSSVQNEEMFILTKMTKYLIMRKVK